MKRLPEGSRRIEDNRLVVRWRTPDGKYLSQGKRVRGTCRLTAEERRMYVKTGGCNVVVALRNRLGLSMQQAWDLLKQERGK